MPTDALPAGWEKGSIATTAVDERSQRPPQLGREIFFLDGTEKRDRGCVRLQLRLALRALREMSFELGVHVRRQLTLDEVGQQAYEIVTAFSVRHRKRALNADFTRVKFSVRRPN
jgi:hypothetical protein